MKMSENRGIVKYWDEKEKYGYVKSRSYGEDLYFDETSFEGNVAEGTRVKFKTVDVNTNSRKIERFVIRE